MTRIITFSELFRVAKMGGVFTRNGIRYGNRVKKLPIQHNTYPKIAKKNEKIVKPYKYSINERNDNDYHLSRT